MPTIFSSFITLYKTKLQILDTPIMYRIDGQWMVFPHSPQIIYNLTTACSRQTNSHQMNEHSGDAIKHDGANKDRPDVTLDLLK